METGGITEIGRLSCPPHDHAAHISALSRLPGAPVLFYGMVSTQPSVSVVFTCWKSTLVPYPQPPFTDIIVAPLQPFPISLLQEAPVVENAVFSLKPGGNAQQFLEVQSAVEALLAEEATCMGFAGGWVFTNAGNVQAYAAVVGWDSVAAHQAWFRRQIEVPDSLLHRYGDVTGDISTVDVVMNR